MPQQILNRTLVRFEICADLAAANALAAALEIQYPGGVATVLQAPAILVNDNMRTGQINTDSALFQGNVAVVFWV